MNVKLTRVDDGVDSEEIILPELPAVIGRGGECPLCLDDRWVSRRHCELALVEGSLMVRDLGSKYGTFVNGSKVAQCRLLPGDVLSVGLSSFAARYEPDSVNQAATPREESALMAAMS